MVHNVNRHEILANAPSLFYNCHACLGSVSSLLCGYHHPPNGRPLIIGVRRCLIVGVRRALDPQYPRSTEAFPTTTISLQGSRKALKSRIINHGS